jgi:hypothetical protein
MFVFKLTVCGSVENVWFKIGSIKIIYLKSVRLYSACEVQF